MTAAECPVGHPFSEKRRAEKNQTRMPKRKKTAEELSSCSLGPLPTECPVERTPYVSVLRFRQKRRAKELSSYSLGPPCGMPAGRTPLSKVEPGMFLLKGGCAQEKADSWRVLFVLSGCSPFGVGVAERTPGLHPLFLSRRAKPEKRKRSCPDESRKTLEVAELRSCYLGAAAKVIEGQGGAEDKAE